MNSITLLAQAIAASPKTFDISPRALLVGGFVRDTLLGLEPKDADVEVYGVDPDALETLVTNLFPHQVNAVGKSFGVLKIHLEDGMEIDVALPRREQKTGPGHKGFQTEGDPTLDPKEAARRRDFTINAIMQDPLTQEMIDPWNGMTDLKEKRLRVVDPASFTEDPLRVYRAVQFVARFHLTIDPESFLLLQKMVARGDLDELPPERITEELKKLFLHAERPSEGLHLMRELGIIERSYPELHALIGTLQDPEWHPEGDVWVHTLMVVDEAAAIIHRDPKAFSEEEHLQILLGALCHDLGKPATTAPGLKAGRLHLRSLGHEGAGEEPTRSLCARWTFSQEVVDGAVMIALRHLQPSALFRVAEKESWPEERYTNAVRKLIKRIYPISWRVLLAAAEADHRGRDLPEARAAHDPALERFAKTVQAHELDAAPTKLLVRGQDLLDRGVPPGPTIGHLIQQIEAARDRGEITTREQALKYLDELLKHA